MATFHEAVAPRKKITTYGKAARRRIPDYGFTALAQKSVTPDTPLHTELALPKAAPAARPATPSKLKSGRPRSVSRTPVAAGADLFDVPQSDDEAPTPKPKPLRKTVKPVAKAKLPTRRKSPVKSLPKVSTYEKGTFDMPDSDDNPPASTPLRKKSPVKSLPKDSTYKKDIFDMPDSDDNAPAPKLPRKTVIAPTKQSTIRRAVSKTPSPPVVSKAKEYEIPSSDEEPKPMSKAALGPAAKQRKVLAVRQRPVSVHSPIPSAAKDVFDVPSDDEMESKPVQKISKKPITNGTSLGSRKSPTVEDATGSRKKLKMSPVDAPLKRLPANDALPFPIARKSKPARGRTTSPKAGQLLKVVARPQLHQATKQAGPPRTSRKPSLSPEALETSTPSVSLSDVDMADVDPAGRHISPKLKKMWGNLLEPSDASEDESPEIEIELMVVEKETKVGTGHTPPRVRSPLSRPAGIMKHARKKSNVLPRRRLIDSLVEQTVEESSSEEESQNDPEVSLETISSDRLDTVMEDAPTKIVQSQVPISDSQNSQTPVPRFTYAKKERSMLNEEDLMAALSMELPSVPAQNGSRRGRRASLSKLPTLPSFHEEEEDDSVAAIRSVHELRQAGSNSRFVDEMDDYLERIGSPGHTAASPRRSGLLDLAGKMQDKNFQRQFRSNGMDQKLFLHLGQETDVVSGFLVVSMLVSLLMEGNMPHIVAQLRRQGITRLLIRLLECQSGVVAVAKDRKSNMSKIAQSLISEHQTYILGLVALWEDLKPEIVSPRTMALKCLELMVRQTREAGNSGDIFSKELTTHLFAIVKSATSELAWSLPREKQAIDFYLALSALESHSIHARTIQDENIWLTEYLPIIADTLQLALSRPLEQFGVLQILALRLTLNVTNNNTPASDVFARAPLISAMGNVVVAWFTQISRFLVEEELFIAVDHLVLVLGVLINFAEWSAVCRESLQSLHSSPTDPLDAMLSAFTDGLERSSQVRRLPSPIHAPLTKPRQTPPPKSKKTSPSATSPSSSATSPSFPPSPRVSKRVNHARTFGLSWRL